eukprot:1209934-Rhodomonas_salina.2
MVVTPGSRGSRAYRTGHVPPWIQAGSLSHSTLPPGSRIAGVSTETGSSIAAASTETGSSMA